MNGHSGGCVSKYGGSYNVHPWLLDLDLDRG